ncbi:hypothetical protein MRO53_12745 [Escherichia coli]|nr:hypothetical protein [Escherichia coli]
MKKRLLAVFVLGLTIATTACAITPAMQKKYERSGCTQMSELNGCDVNKSYEWNRDHGFIDNTENHQNRHHRHGEDQPRNHDQAGIYGKFSGNYAANFENGQRSVDIHIEDSTVYVNGNEVRDINTYKDTMTFRVGYSTYTIKANGRGSWIDPDAGNAGKIVRE